MHQPNLNDGEARADRHLIFALLSFSMLTFIMQFGMVSVSLGELTEDLDAGRFYGSVTVVDPFA